MGLTRTESSLGSQKSRQEPGLPSLLRLSANSMSFSSVKADLAEPNNMIGKVQHFQALQQAIQFAEQSHRVTGQNIANINTPGYQTKEVSFEQLVDRVSDPRASRGAAFEVTEATGLEQRNDGNNVDLDCELAALKKNAMAYQTLTQLLGSKMGILKQAING